MFLTRNGHLEETFFTFSTSPVRDESGNIGGLFHPVTETTTSMLAEGRTRSLRDLNAALPTATSQAAVNELALQTLGGFNLDLPFLLSYRLQAKEMGAGSGLGLTQVYAFAQSSGGQARISSVPGEGTVVTLVLPRATEEVQAAKNEDALSAPPRKTGAVLLVEDDEEVLPR